MRPHVAALYAFARVADDIADEGDGAGRPNASATCTRGRAACTAPSNRPASQSDAERRAIDDGD